MAGGLDIAAGDIGKRQLAIQKLVAASQDEAFDKLIDFANDFGVVAHKHDAIVISAEYAEIRRAEKRESMDSDQIVKSQRRLRYQMLELLEEIVSRRQLAEAA